MAHGCDVHLACGAEGREESLAAFGATEGVTVHALPLVREPSAAADVRAAVAIVRLVRRLRPDLVNASTPKAGLLVTTAARLLRVPVRVYVVRGLRYEGATGRGRRVLQVLEGRAMRAATHVVFNSASLRRVAEADGLCRSGRGIVIGAGSGNGVELRRFEHRPTRTAARAELGLPVDAFVVGFVGRLTRDKGIADLVAAFDRLGATPEGSAAALLVVGEPEAGDPVAPEVLERLRSDPTVVLRPWMEDTAVAYAAMDALAFPSRREGLPNVPLEAQACEVPVVAYAATGTVDAVRDGETGALVPVGDVDGLAAALSVLAADPAMAAARGARGRAWVAEAFVPTRVWTDLAARYDRWLAAAGRPVPSGGAGR